MKTFHAMMLPVVVSIMSSACNERAQMGQAEQRSRQSGSVIPESFNNNLSQEQFRSRSLTLTGTALTLSANLEAVLAGNEGNLDNQTNNEPVKEPFSAACKSLALITGGVSSSDEIKNLSKQTSLNLTTGQTNCNDIPGITGIDTFRSMNAIRFLATKISATEQEVMDCLSMQPAKAGRQAAVAWKLAPVLGSGTWLEGKSLSRFDGSVEGGGNDRQNAFSAHVHLDVKDQATNERQKLTSSIAAFNEVDLNKTLLEKVEHFEREVSTDAGTANTSAQVRLTKIELDYANSEIKETTTYRDLYNGALVSEWQVSAIISGKDNFLTMELSAPGSNSLVQYSLADDNNLSCSVSN